VPLLLKRRCDRTLGNACPGRLYNELIAPLVGFNLRAALWSQAGLLTFSATIQTPYNHHTAY
jgi:hypothetical protein